MRASEVETTAPQIAIKVVKEIVLLVQSIIEQQPY